MPSVQVSYFLAAGSYPNDAPGSMSPEQAWVVDILNSAQTTAMLKWLKQSGLETPEMAHLKRIRRQQGADTKITVILTYVYKHPDPPSLPDIELSEAYIVPVPRSAALTITSLAIKNTLWPTVYAPKRKGEVECWSRGKVLWACEAMKKTIEEAQEARQRDELPIVAHVPVPYDEETQAATQVLTALTAYDTRKSAMHPLRHAIPNVIRAVAELRASSTATHIPTPSVADSPGSTPNAVVVDVLTPHDTDEGSISRVTTPSSFRNGAHYLLTSLTLFTTHEPCIMCSMALLHSRVKEIIYLIPMDATGGCGGAACVPKLEGINHRYGIGAWKLGGKLGDEYGLDIDVTIDA